MSTAPVVGAGASNTGTAEALSAIDRLYTLARERVKARVSEGGKIIASKLDAEQLAAHALAYLASEHHAAAQIDAWATALGAAGDASYERLIADTYVAELVRALRGGVDLGQTEVIPLSEMGITPAEVKETIERADVAAWADAQTAGARYLQIARTAKDKGGGALGLTDETLIATQREFRKFTDREVKPIAQDVHRKDVLIPMELLTKMSELGVFGLTIPEEYGGLGLGKIAMCVVTEELSRGYVGVGSLGTRAEIAAELILGGGTKEQKAEWLPRIAAGEVLPTAVFTEPNNGSDLAHIQTRAVRTEGKDGDTWKVSGQKTWITHACRADLMTLMARTKMEDGGYGGLSMFLAPKTRTGEEGKPEFVDEGLTGTEIKVLGYRGMKEYELSFDGFQVPGNALLGAYPDGGARRRRGAGGARGGADVRAAAHPVRQADLRVPARGAENRAHGVPHPGGASAHVLRREPEGHREAVRPRGGHGQAPGHARGVGVGRRLRPDPRRQRLRRGVHGEPPPGRRARPLDLRGGQRDPGARGRAPPPGSLIQRAACSSRPAGSARR
jgi:(2S)-methylsuccinyl-CoA dehydrogenase